MLIQHDREKLINAIVYFALNTEKFGTMKCAKLLYLLDFAHYRETGRSVTGSEYLAYDQGPVPYVVWKELKDGPENDLAKAVRFQRIPTLMRPMRKILARIPFDSSHFSPRELRIMTELAEEHYYNSADEMVLRTHLPTEPWHAVYKDEGRKNAPIPYGYALDPEDREELEDIARDHEAIVKNYAR